MYIVRGRGPHICKTDNRSKRQSKREKCSAHYGLAICKVTCNFWINFDFVDLTGAILRVSAIDTVGARSELNNIMLQCPNFGNIILADWREEFLGQS